MLIFVDYEHAEMYENPDMEWLLAARARITYKLEDLSGMPCMLVRYNRISTDLLEHLDVRAIFISGQGTDPDRYDPKETAAFEDIVRTSSLPIFGFCGGWQFAATALGAQLEAIDVPSEHTEDEIITEWPGGRLAEFGYHPVEHVAEHPLLDGLGPTSTHRHAHALHIPTAPEGFTTLASTPVTPVQLAVNDDRRVVGTQFHPEYWTDEHPDGRQLITNFLRWANVL